MAKRPPIATSYSDPYIHVRKVHSTTNIRTLIPDFKHSRTVSVCEKKLVTGRTVVQSKLDHLKHLIEKQKRSVSVDRQKLIDVLYREVFPFREGHKLVTVFDRFGYDKVEYELAECNVWPHTRVQSANNFYNKQMFAANLRENLTPSEAAILPQMTKLGFKAQVVVFGYIPDFIHLQKKIVVEVDGSIHLSEKQQQWDLKRDAVFVNRGYKVLRVTNDEVSHNREAVYQKVYNLLQGY